jgi:hypothetical protein
MSGSGSARPGAVAWPRSNLNDSAADGVFRTHSLAACCMYGTNCRRILAQRHQLVRLEFHGYVVLRSVVVTDAAAGFRGEGTEHFQSAPVDKIVPLEQCSASEQAHELALAQVAEVRCSWCGRLVCRDADRRFRGPGG